MPRFVRILLGSMVLLTVASTASAQYPHRHEGIYATTGLGYGLAKVSCDQCGSSDRTGDLTAFLHVGGALSQSILLGGEVTAWSKVTESNDNRAVGTVNAVLTWYPSTREGFFIKGGVGLGYLRGDQDTDTGPIFFDKGGVGYQLGLGYDLRIERNLSVTAVANWFGGNVGDIGAIRNVTFNVIQLMAAVTFH